MHGAVRCGAAARSAVLVDVRIADKYASGHADGSLSVPLYNAISTWDLPSLIRRAAFAFFGARAYAPHSLPPHGQGGNQMKTCLFVSQLSGSGLWLARVRG